MHTVPADKISANTASRDTPSERGPSPIERGNRQATKAHRKKLRAAAYRDERLSLGAKATLAYLTTCRPGRHGWAKVWLRALCAHLRRQPSTVLAYLAELRHLGYLERLPSYRERNEHGEIRSVGPCSYRLPRAPRGKAAGRDRRLTGQRCSPTTGEGGRTPPPPTPPDNHTHTQTVTSPSLSVPNDSTQRGLAACRAALARQRQ